MRDTIIFSGASHTFGLGLEWELDPELNSEEYLQKGIHLPISRLPHYQNYWKQYRWPTLVCNELGYKQFNIHDEEHKEKYQLKVGGNSIETIWSLVKNENFLKELLEKTKYVILEIGGIRWYDEVLHDGPEGYKYPNTILEIIEVINNPKTDSEVLTKALEWISTIDEKSYVIELCKKIEYLKSKYNDITFLILPWYMDESGFFKSKELKNNIIRIQENTSIFINVNQFLTKNKLKIQDKAKAFNGNYKFNYEEEHASVEGHMRIAKIVSKYIKKLENDKKE